MSTYYLATNGSDQNTGGEQDPWLTLAYASWQVRAGDTLYIRGGTYTGVGVWTVFPYDGTVDNRITVDNYPGETVIFDGQDTYPDDSVYSFLISVPGAYTTIRDITIHDSHGSGLRLTGVGSWAINITGIDSREAGLLLGGTSEIADGCSWTNCGWGYGVDGQTSWGAGIGSTGTDCIIRNCVSHTNIGEGINMGGAVNGCITEDCIIYNNDSANLYFDSSINCTARRNFVYDTTVSPINGIVIGGESHQPYGNTIENNIVVGTFVNFQTDGNVTQLIDTKIVHNTFVNAKGDLSGYDMGVYFRDLTTYSGSVFKDNIVVEEDAGRRPLTVLDAVHAGLDFDYNCYNKAVDAEEQGANDVVDDPELINTAGTTSASFKIGATSPCKDVGTDVGVYTDYFGNLRPLGILPDIGAHEVVAAGYKIQESFRMTKV